MIYLLTDKKIIRLYSGTDEVYNKMNFFQKHKVNKYIKKIIKLTSNSRTLKLVSEEDTISYTLKISKMFPKPVILNIGSDQYLSTSDFWRDYVCFK